MIGSAARLRLFGALEPAPLAAVLRVGRCALIGGLAQAQALEADAEASPVHHREHAAQALVRLADQVALGLVEVHHAGGRAVNAHLLLDGAAGDPVGRPRRAVFLEPALRHQEEADAAHARRRVGQLRQHEVDDVLGQVMLAGGDEDLGAGERVAALARRHRLGADEAQVRAAVGLGQAHGAAPGAVAQVWQVGLLQPLRGVQLDHRGGTVGEQRVHAESQIRRAHHLVEDHADELRQPLAAVVRRHGDAGPAGIDEGLVGLLVALRCAHHAVLVVAAFLVRRAIERQQRVLAELGALLDHGVDHVGRGVLVAGQRGELAHVEQLVEHEAHVAKRRAIGLHHRLLSILRNAALSCRA